MDFLPANILVLCVNYCFLFLILVVFYQFNYEGEKVSVLHSEYSITQPQGTYKGFFTKKKI